MKSLIESSKLALEFNETVKSKNSSTVLHNSAVSLNEAQVDMLCNSKDWYNNELQKSYISEEDRTEYRGNLSLIKEELKFRGIKIEEGIFSSMLKKAALSMTSAKDIANGWYEGADSEMKKLKSSLSHDNVEKFIASSLALSRVRDEAASLKSGKDAMIFLGDSSKIEALIKKHTEEILKKGLLNMREESIEEAYASSQTGAFVKFLNDNSGNRLLIAKAFDDIADAADSITKEERGGIGGLSISETRWNGVGNMLRKVVAAFK